MYSEKTFKNYIFWIQVKRIVIILLLTCIGAAIGVLVSELCESITKSNAFNVLIIAGTTVFMFLFSLLLTTSTGKEVQDGYWKIAVLRKLTTIQKLIEANNSLLGNGSNAFNKEILNKEIDLSVQKISEGLVSTTISDLEYEEDEVESENVKIKVKSADKNAEKVEEKKIDKKATDLVVVKKKKDNKKRNITKVKELV